jgi:hypothetical protein
MLFDDVLSQTTTDTEGKYSLGGKNVELNWITPLITAKHACDLSITMEDGDRFPSPLGKVGSLFL